MRIGIDVGGTNTDAVLLDDATVLASTKISTTSEITGGIVDALAELRRQHDFPDDDVQAVMLGTTHFVNALVQARDLAPVAALRLSLPAGSAVPPMVDWPQRLVDATAARGYLVHGGHEFDGRNITAPDEDEIARAAADMAARGVRSIAITSVFSPVNAEFEQSAAEVVRREMPHAAISLSHEIGRVGLVERENATAINAALRELADEIVDGLRVSLRQAGINAPLYLSQNDGTLMDPDFARRYPVATFTSGPTNSMRGAAVLSGSDECVVVDVGGTTSDVGVLHRGFPRQSATAADIAGTRTNFRMPDVFSCGIGGGSLVRTDPAVTVGPESVGHALTHESLVFGGDTLTATDIAVAAGRMRVGDPKRVAHLDAGLVHQALERITAATSAAVDRMRTARDPQPVVAVGGGAALLPEALPEAAQLHCPQHHAVANAIGAAIAQVGGEVDRIYPIGPGGRDAALDDARNEACDNAIAAGADPRSVEIVDVDEVPVPYLPGNATRIRIKAVGELRTGS